MHRCQQSDQLRPLWAAGLAPHPRTAWQHTQSLDQALHLQVSVTAVFSKAWNKLVWWESKSLLPLTQSLLAELLLAALPQFCHQPFHQEILGPQVTSVTSASLQLSQPCQEPGAPQADTCAWGVAKPQPALLRTSLWTIKKQSMWSSPVPGNIFSNRNSVQERKVFECFLSIQVLKAES